MDFHDISYDFMRFHGFHGFHKISWWLLAGRMMRRRGSKDFSHARRSGEVGGFWLRVIAHFYSGHIIHINFSRQISWQCFCFLSFSRLILEKGNFQKQITPPPHPPTYASAGLVTISAPQPLPRLLGPSCERVKWKHISNAVAHDPAWALCWHPLSILSFGSGWSDGCVGWLWMVGGCTL